MEENFYLNYDATTGDILGFYLKSIHGDNIPNPSIEITPEKHEFYMQNNGKYRLNPKTLEDELIPVVETTPEPTQEELLKKQLLETQASLASLQEQILLNQAGGK